ncbi:hypothetical protein [Lacinutrix chionoecetis]
MKTTFKLFTLFILVTFSSCDNAKKMEYKYAESPKLLACDFPNGDLFNEAVYSFENDIINHYDKQNKNVTRAYSNFLSMRLRNKMDVKEFASEHSLNLAKALKTESDLWTTSNNNNNISLDYSHPIIDCIANNIKDKDVKTTYNALLATNSLKPELVLPLLIGNSRSIQIDGGLKSYVALDFFYSKLLDLKLEDLKNPNPEEQPNPAEPAINGVDINRTPQPITPEQDPHAGHNHD